MAPSFVFLFGKIIIHLRVPFLYAYASKKRTILIFLIESNFRLFQGSPSFSFAKS